MSKHKETIESVRREIRAGRPPPSIDAACEMLTLASIGRRYQTPLLDTGARMFRIRKMNAKPSNRSEVGAPPAGLAGIQRLNLQSESVLYLGDSPATAFAEARAEPGEYCLSEWRTNRDRIVVANGGFNDEELARFFGTESLIGSTPLGGAEDHDVAALFRDLFFINTGNDPTMYWWSIACGRANGFSAICERTTTELINGNTRWTGRFPLGGIAYLSVRKDRAAVNYCFNDLGQTYLDLHHVQWVKLESDGSFSGLDIATSWSGDGEISWEGRPPHYILEPGQEARLVKVANDVWSYENLDGSIP